MDFSMKKPSFTLVSNLSQNFSVFVLQSYSLLHIVCVQVVAQQLKEYLWVCSDAFISPDIF